MTTDRAGALVDDLAADDLLPEVGIRTRAVHADEHVKVVAIAIAAGSELGDHAAPAAAIIQVVRGRADIEMDGRRIADAGPGTWVMMPPRMRHAVRAHEPTVLALTIIRGNAA
jgi:quercetin dioxygenase-like cupin family protein